MTFISELLDNEQLLRDYFAATVLQGLVTGIDPYEVGKNDHMSAAIECAYRYADLMMIKRQQ
jgi:hypothetical protein